MFPGFKSRWTIPFEFRAFIAQPTNTTITFCSCTGYKNNLGELLLFTNKKNNGKYRKRKKYLFPYFDIITKKWWMIFIEGLTDLQWTYVSLFLQCCYSTANNNNNNSNNYNYKLNIQYIIITVKKYSTVAYYKSQRTYCMSFQPIKHILHQQMQCLYQFTQF